MLNGCIFSTYEESESVIYSKNLKAERLITCELDSVQLKLPFERVMRICDSVLRENETLANYAELKKKLEKPTLIFSLKRDDLDSCFDCYQGALYSIAHDLAAKGEVVLILKNGKVLKSYNKKFVSTGALGNATITYYLDNGHVFLGSAEL